ncbi:hypothetical protein RJ640_008108, partial [Escallonia rubra]
IRAEMEDVLTDIPPPSRFFLEDLNNFTPPPPPLPYPFLLFSTPNPIKPLRPSLLIIALSSPSLNFFHHVSKTLIGTLILPEIPFSGNSVQPSLRDRSCNIYALNDADQSTILVSVQYAVAAERAHSVAKTLINEQMLPERVLILDSVQSRNFRGKLPPDDTFALKLETSGERKGVDDGQLLRGVDYFPSGSVVDGLAAALLSRCQVNKIKGTLCVSWPESGGSVTSLVKSLLLKDVLPGLEHGIDSFGEGEHFSREEKDMALSLYSRPLFFMLLVVNFLSYSLHASDPPLTLDYYQSKCPDFLGIVKKEMECAVLTDPRNAALVLRLHFHDCFVQGCDGSVLLDDTVMLQGEKKAPINLKALKGFKIIDRIKNKLESECPGIVSCADILTIAARDAVVLVGGPYWHVPLGRKDSKNAGYALVSTNLPDANDGLLSIISKFLNQGLTVTDMVALSGAHTIGMARCANFRARIYGDYQATSGLDSTSETNLNKLKSICPAAVGGDNKESAMDYVTPNLFDNSYYHLLLRGEGLINSDQELYSSVFGVQTKKLVQEYAENAVAFFEQFSESMVKMGNITDPDTFVDGEVRKNCRFVNT